MQNEIKKTYGLTNAITMIVGSVIGSGIYFKADDILMFTGGKLWLGIVLIIFGALVIVFGSLALAQLAQRSSQAGGIASYIGDFVSPALATGVGAYQAFVYFPIFTVIVSWVGSAYTWSIFNPNASLEAKIALTFVYMSGIVAINYLSKKLAGQFQSAATFIKVIPLVIIAIVGFFWSKDLPIVPQGIKVIEPFDNGWGWLASLVPLAFTYDGWTVAATIAPEVKNPRRHLPLAYTLGPLAIVFIYVVYFWGLNEILGETFILSTGNVAIQYAAQMILGKGFASAIIFCVIVSVMGVADGMYLAAQRLPQAMAERQWIQSPRLAKLHPKYQVSTASTLLTYGLTIFWLGIHYLVEKYQWLPGSDICESAVVFNSICLLPLFYATYRLHKQGEIKSAFFGIVCPLLATFGIIILVVGSIVLNWKVALLTMTMSVIFVVYFIRLYQKNH